MILSLSGPSVHVTRQGVVIIIELRAGDVNAGTIQQPGFAVNAREAVQDSACPLMEAKKRTTYAGVILSKP